MASIAIRDMEESQELTRGERGQIGQIRGGICFAASKPVVFPKWLKYFNPTDHLHFDLRFPGVKRNRLTQAV